jgi:hypothetical protein
MHSILALKLGVTVELNVGSPGVGSDRRRVSNDKLIGDRGIQQRS